MSSKVLFITDIGVPWGGSEELWAKSAHLLIEKNIQVYTSIGFYGSVHKKVQSLKEKGCRVLIRKNKLRVLLPKLKSKFGFFNKTSIYSAIEKHIITSKADLVVFSQTSSFSMYEEMIFCYANGIKYVSLTQLNSEYSWPTDSNYKQVRAAYANALQNYFVSQGNLTLFETQIAQRLTNSSVISNPFNFDSIQSIPWPKDEILQFAYVGRLDFSHKGIDTLLTCFSHPKWANRNMQLNIYGGGNVELAKELTAYLGASKIIFHGHVDGIINLWKSNHILVMASRYEGMPLSILEAMFCRRPVIATPVAGHGEYIINNVTGFLAKGTSVELLEEAIEEAWQERNRWEEMGKSSFKRVKDISSKDPVGLFTNELTSHLH